MGSVWVVTGQVLSYCILEGEGLYLRMRKQYRQLRRLVLEGATTETLNRMPPRLIRFGVLTAAVLCRISLDLRVFPPSSTSVISHSVRFFGRTNQKFYPVPHHRCVSLFNALPVDAK